MKWYKQFNLVNTNIYKRTKKNIIVYYLTKYYLILKTIKENILRK